MQPRSARQEAWTFRTGSGAKASTMHRRDNECLRQVGRFLQRVGSCDFIAVVMMTGSLGVGSAPTGACKASSEGFTRVSTRVERPRCSIPLSALRISRARSLNTGAGRRACAILTARRHDRGRSSAAHPPSTAIHQRLGHSAPALRTNRLHRPWPCPEDAVRITACP